MMYMGWRVPASPAVGGVIGLITLFGLAVGLGFYNSSAAQPARDNSQAPVVIPISIRPAIISVSNVSVTGKVAVKGASTAMSAKTAAGSSAITDQLFSLVNQQRAQNGLAPLARDPRLDASAAAKCQDMVAKNYWAHVSPSGEQPWQFIQDQGVSYSSAGENLATGYDTAQLIVNAWMNSPEHRTNILNPAFNYVGYAVCYSPSFVGDGGEPALITVQHFAQE